MLTDTLRFLWVPAHSLEELTIMDFDETSPKTLILGIGKHIYGSRIFCLVFQRWHYIFPNVDSPAIVLGTLRIYDRDDQDDAY